MKTNQVVERRFSNSYGERWRLRVDVAHGNGTLAGDETGWAEPGIRIREHQVDQNVILADDEADWLNRIWLELTGQELVLPSFNRIAVAVADLMREVPDFPGKSDV